MKSILDCLIFNKIVLMKLYMLLGNQNRFKVPEFHRDFVIKILKKC